jgi:hypothetical protein
MIGVALVLFIGVLGLSVLVLAITRSQSLDYERTRTRLHQPGSQTLTYDIPDGQDPADVIVALGHAGYPAVEDSGHGHHQVLVFCPDGRLGDRPRVRAVIAQVRAPGSARVRFVDEP